MIFATDLDQTLIFSYKHLTGKSPVVPVEFKDGKELSYMTTESFEKINKLKEKMTIIPVTARSTEQFERIIFTKEFKYAILANGATILKNGIPVEDWQKHINKIKQDKKFDYDYFLKFLEDKQKYFRIKPRIVNDAIIFFKFEQIPDNFMFDIYKSAGILKWNFILQGMKGYIFPREISKDNALKYLYNEIKDDKLITAGDGNLDVDMINLGNVFKFVPNNSDACKIIKDKEKFIIPEGIDGTIEMLNIVEKCLKEKENEIFI